MKKIARIIFALTLVFVLASALSGCALLDQYKKWDGTLAEVTENSKECVESFAEELAEGDIDGASAYLHPNSTPAADELEDFIKDLETKHDFDFTEEVTFEFGGFNPEVNLEHVKYDVAVNVNVGGEVIVLKLGILSDADGFGIYNISVD